MRIAVLGDSISAGLGVRGFSYGDRLKERLDLKSQRPVTVHNLAGSAMQISESLTKLPEVVRLRPDWVILAHGITEAIVRPTESALRYVPARWRKAGWMDPRPYYSKRLRRVIVQRIESSIRWRVKVFLIRRGGGITWKTIEEFEDLMIRAIEKLLTETECRIVLLSHCGIDERYYPDSSGSLNRYQTVVERIYDKYRSGGRVHYCDVSGVCDRWNDYFEDHFHPNASGHEKMAKQLYDTLISADMMVREGVRA